MHQHHRQPSVKENRKLSLLLGSLLITAYVICGLPCCCRTASAAEVTNYEWEWTDSELKKIKKLAKKIDEDDDGFFTYEEKDFIVRSDISKDFVAELTFYMDSFVEEFPKVFPVPPKGTVFTKLTVTIYKDRSGYLDSSPDVPEWSGGLFYPDWSKPGWPVWNVLSYPWEEEGKDFVYFNRPVLQHEGAHAMFQKFTGKSLIPVFFNEGVATYFEWWNLREDTKTNQEERDKRTYRWRLLRQKYTQEPEFSPSLEECMNMTHEDWGSGLKSEIAFRYALAESFTSFLLSDSKGRKKFKDIVEEMYKGHPLIKEKQYKKLEKDWHEYIKTILLPLAPPLYKIGTGENTAADRSFALGWLSGKSLKAAFEKTPDFDPENQADIDEQIESIMDVIKSIVAPEEDSKKKSKRAKKKGSSKDTEDTALGTAIGEFLKTKGSEVNLYYLQRGFEDGIAGETREVSTEEMLKRLCETHAEEAAALSKVIEEVETGKKSEN